jgi:predicted TIM-barrel fold metal-dependent hydrolase
VAPATSVDEVLRDIKVIDVDTHVLEPYDLWTSRVSVKKWGDKVPHVVWDDALQCEVWLTGDEMLRAGAAGAGYAGYDKAAPATPRQWSEVKTEVWEPNERLDLMTRHGIHAAVLYPNVSGFGAGKFANVAGEDGAFALELIKAYNDFLVDFSGADPARYIPITAVPFWDIDASITEIARCAENGHRGIIFSQQPELFGCPPLGSRHWDRLWGAVEEMGLSVNFHIGSAGFDMDLLPPEAGRRSNFATVAGLNFMSNARAIATVIGSGIPHRFPDLKLVSVESGIGWIPFLLQGLDWMWKNGAVTDEHPEYDLLPSEYFRRQMYGCFWFEGADSLSAAIEYLGDDRILYETDFPHPASMWPGPASAGVPAEEYIARDLAHLPELTLRRVLHDNAAALYKID